MVYPEEWNCPICSAENYNIRYCEKCTFPRLWSCPRCKNENHNITICSKCGYNSLNPKLSKTKVNKSIFIIVGLIIYGIIMYFVITNLLKQEGLVSRGGIIDLPFNISFFTDKELTNVTIEFTLLNNYQEFILTKNEKYWFNNNIILNQAGDWMVKIMENNGTSNTIYDSTIHVYKECITNEDCIIISPTYICNKKTEECKKKDVGFTDFLGEI